MEILEPKEANIRLHTQGSLLKITCAQSRSLSQEFVLAGQ